jgi:hypothetical protein
LEARAASLAELDGARVKVRSEFEALSRRLGDVRGQLERCKSNCALGPKRTPESFDNCVGICLGPNKGVAEDLVRSELRLKEQLEALDNETRSIRAEGAWYNQAIALMDENTSTCARDALARWSHLGYPAPDTLSSAVKAAAGGQTYMQLEPLTTDSFPHGLLCESNDWALWTSLRTCSMMQNDTLLFSKSASGRCTLEFPLELVQANPANVYCRSDLASGKRTIRFTFVPLQVSGPPCYFWTWELRGHEQRGKHRRLLGVILLAKLKVEPDPAIRDTIERLLELTFRNSWRFDAPQRVKWERSDCLPW